MRSRLLLATTALAIAALAPAAHAGTGSVQYVGDPLTFLRVGRPATQLTTAFQLNAALPAGSSATVQSSGGNVLATATPKILGTSGLCYSVAFTMPSAVSNGSVLNIVLDPGGAQTALAPNAELVRTLNAKQQRNLAATVGAGSC
jgi:hypothetical protein